MGALVDMARKLRPLIEKAAQNLDDSDAVNAPQLYREWEPGVRYEPGHKLRRHGRVCVVNDNQGHTSQPGWEPENAHSLFRFIDETHAGTAADPIPYSGNMVLQESLYYVQDGVIYLCTRDTGNPVYHTLADLVGLYVVVSS